MANEVWPYRRADPLACVFGAWNLGIEGDYVALPRFVEGWDSNAVLPISRIVTCDLELLRESARLPRSSALVLTVSWTNRITFFSEALYRAPLASMQRLDVTLPSERLGGEIDIRTTITIGSTDRSAPSGVARWAGSILAGDSQSVLLEGDGTMFPVSAVDFAHTRYPPESSWILEVHDHLSAPTLGAILLLVNSRDQELVDALGARKPTPRQAALLDEIEAGVATQLIEMAVDRIDDLQGRDNDPESIGGLLASYLALAKGHDLVLANGAASPSEAAAVLSGVVRSAGFGRRFK